jgi:hypothetical protein
VLLGLGELGLCLGFRVEVQTLIEKANVHLLSWTLGPFGAERFGKYAANDRRPALEAIRFGRNVSV